MLNWNQCSTVERLAGKVSGAWVFKGTRVPVATLFENIESGARVEDFLQWFPGVRREQVEAVLTHAGRSLIEACPPPRKFVKPKVGHSAPAS
ncbi:MAG: DUF433 domain-containing protein [Phycisphaerales bacterium]